MKTATSTLWTLALGSLACLGAAVVVDSNVQSCDIPRVSDGCSVPPSLSADVMCQEYFTPACDRHDACYLCGAHFNISRNQCDSAFHKDMTQLCSKNASGCEENEHHRRKGDDVKRTASSLTQRKGSFSLIDTMATAVEASSLAAGKDGIGRAAVPVLGGLVF